MKLGKALLTGTLLTFGAAALANPRISSSTVHAYHKALTEANDGDLEMAAATLRCLLMADPVTVSLQGSPSFASAISHGIRVWTARMPQTPFQFTRSESPDLKVVLVHGIPSGGDIQGQVKCERQVHAGPSGSGYRIRGTILIRDNVDGRPITPAEAASVLEHELGHVFGLDDDSDPGVLMGPFVPGRPVQGPGDQELYVLGTFRNALQDALSQVLDRNDSLRTGGGANLAWRRAQHRVVRAQHRGKVRRRRGPRAAHS